MRNVRPGRVLEGSLLGTTLLLLAVIGGGAVNGKGSAIYFNGFGGPLILDSVIVQNNDSTAISGSEGAIYYLGGTGHRITNSTFTGNSIQERVSCRKFAETSGYQWLNGNFPIRRKAGMRPLAPLLWRRHLCNPRCGRRPGAET